MPRPEKQGKVRQMKFTAAPHPLYLSSCKCHPRAKKCYNALWRGLRRYVETSILVPLRVDSSEAYSFLGCNIQEWADYLASRFDVRMGWDNWGTVWNIHYVKNLGEFQATIDEEIAAAFHYTNTLPKMISDIRLAQRGFQPLSMSDQAAAIYGVHSKAYRARLAPIMPDWDENGKPIRPIKPKPNK